MIKLADLLECGGCERQSMDWTHGQDHEASMADSELRDTISNASKIMNMVEPGDELPGWVSAYITLASDYMNSVAQYMEGKMHEKSEEVQAVPDYAVYEVRSQDAYTAEYRKGYRDGYHDRKENKPAKL
jgi:hypothetical protein